MGAGKTVLKAGLKAGLKAATAVGGVTLGLGAGYGIAVVRVRIQSALFPKFWAESARTQLELDESLQELPPLTVNVLGDSAASGVGASKPERAYVGLLKQRLEEETGRRVSVTNISVPGASSWLLMEKQLPLLDDLPQADITMCVIGANDLIDPAYTLEGFEWTATRLYKRLPAGTVVSTIPSFGLPWLEPKVRAANAIIEREARLYDLELADLFSTTHELGLWRYLLYTGGDIFHPSERGYVAWASALWPAVRRAAKRALAQKAHQTEKAQEAPAPSSSAKASSQG